MATFAPISAPHSTARLIARQRAETEQAIAEIRYDASLDDRERARRITQIVAEANGRVLALASRRYRAATA
jgi:hypothetical protein